MQGISLFWGRNCDTIASIELIQLELLAARPWNEQGILTRYQGILFPDTVAREVGLRPMTYRRGL